MVELEAEPGIVVLNEGWAVAETVLEPMAVTVRPALELADSAVFVGLGDVVKLATKADADGPNED